jgi:hypothetical protein
LAMFGGCGGEVRLLWPSRIYCGEEGFATKIVLWLLRILYCTVHAVGLFGKEAFVAFVAK